MNVIMIMMTTPTKMMMTKNSVLIRASDKKKFKVTFLSHWSDIKSEDGEEDYVKFFWDGEYVSHSKGHHYYLEEEE